MRESGRIYDELLVLHVQAGDRRALGELARRWQPRLLRTARRLTGDGEGARDLVQECWIGILRGLPRLRDPARFPAWAFGILHRRAASAIAGTVRRRERSAPLDTEATDTPDATTAGPFDGLALERAFGALSADQRLAATLFFVERLTLAEIALVSGVPLGTVKSRIFHARRILKTHLTGDDQ